LFARDLPVCGEIARRAECRPKVRTKACVPREAVAKRIAEAIAAIDYPKVKPAVSVDRQLTYLQAWVEIYVALFP
jgi:hypothetical protein